MSFYSDPFYGDVFYASSGVDAPADLDFYRTDTDNVYVFHWTFKPEFISTSLATFDYELQIDKSDTFDTVDFQSFTSATALTYQNGNANKGYSVDVYPREESTIITFYARVRVKNGLNYGDFSDTLTVTTLPLVITETADRLLSELPDHHVYPKDEVNLSLSDRVTNISKVYEGEAEEFDRAFLEKEQVITDALPRRVRDERIYDVLGSRFGWAKPSTMQFVDYRHCLGHLKEATFVGGTIEAIKLVAGCFTGVTPDIVPFSELLGFITAGRQTESLTIPASPAYDVALSELPRNVPTISGFTYVDNVPLASEFTVDFATGVLTFNAADAGAAITVVYTALSNIHTTLDPSNPPVIYTRLEAGSAILIILNNPGNFTLDLASINFLLKQIIPAHIRFVLTVA